MAAPRTSRDHIATLPADAAQHQPTGHNVAPFVSHAFAHVDLGQVGLLKVGNPTGTMSH